jgi:hypothetical protein
MATEQGDLAAARTFLEEALALQRALGVMAQLAHTLGRLGRVARLAGDYAEARVLYVESLSTVKDLGDRNGLAGMLVELGGLAASEGQAARSARLFGAAAAVRAAIGSVMPPILRDQYERDMAAAQAALGEAAFEAAWAAGQALSLDMVVAEALTDQPA